jgi:hypothetical protein
LTECTSRVTISFLPPKARQRLIISPYRDHATLEGSTPMLKFSKKNGCRNLIGTYCLCLSVLLSGCHKQKPPTLIRSASAVNKPVARSSSSSAPSTNTTFPPVSRLSGSGNSEGLRQPQNADQGDYITYTFQAYEKLECQVNWDQRCFEDVVIDAGDGFQACNISWTITSQVPDPQKPHNGSASSGTSAFAANLYPNEKENPARYRSIGIRIFANGSGDWLNRAGAAITLMNVEMSVIDDRATNADRRREGCTFNLRPLG